MKNLFDRARLFFSKDKEFRSALYKIMGFCPHNIDLYRTAFAHKSHEYRSKKTGNKPLNNERLEFLGDAVLETVVSHIVYRQYPNKREGFLTNTRSKIVSRESLGKLAKELGIDRLIQSQTHGRTHNSYLEGNSFEALMGAIYLDRGFRYAFQFIEKRIIGAVLDLDDVANKEVNFKSKLLEWKQKNRIHLDFVDSVSNSTNSTSPSFHTSVVIEGIPAGEGKGFSKKESHQAAAKDALTQMRRDADFLDAMFRAKEKRTAMGAEEFFALPHIAEIDEQIAKERNGEKSERNEKRGERNEKRNDRKNERAERNEGRNAQREERNEKRGERKNEREERKSDRDNNKKVREERNESRNEKREERKNEREERKSDRDNNKKVREERNEKREERGAQSVDKAERKERSEQKATTPREVKAKKVETAAPAPEVAADPTPAPPAEAVVATTETVVAPVETVVTPAEPAALVPEPAPEAAPLPQPAQDKQEETAVAQVAEAATEEQVPTPTILADEPTKIIPVAFVELPQQEAAPAEVTQQELNDWYEAADDACDFMSIDKPHAEEAPAVAEVAQAVSPEVVATAAAEEVVVPETPATAEVEVEAVSTTDEPATEAAAPQVRSEQEKKRARRQNKRQNAAAYTNTTLPPAEQSHRAAKAERKQKEQAELHQEQKRQRQVEKAQQELKEAFQLDVEIDDFTVVEAAPATTTDAAPQAGEEKRKNNRSRGGRRGGANRRRGGNRSNNAQQEGGKSETASAN